MFHPISSRLRCKPRVGAACRPFGYIAIDEKIEAFDVFLSAEMRIESNSAPLQICRGSQTNKPSQTTRIQPNRIIPEESQ